MNILPCPHCRNKTIVVRHTDAARVFCPECQCAGPWQDGSEAAVRAWNAIAAAPDLLLACQLVKMWKEKHPESRLGGVTWAELNRAIVRALGEEASHA